MSPWESVLLAFGGNALLLLVLGWLARSLGTQLLTKDIEKFKTGLTAANQATQERLKHSLQMMALEHQVRFSKLHERRADVVAEAYALLVDVHRQGGLFVSPMEFAGAPSKQDRYRVAADSAITFRLYFDKNRIWLPKKVCDRIDAFLLGMQKEVVGFGVRLRREGQMFDSGESELKAWIKASEYFEKEVPKAKEALEQELRSLIGDSSLQRDPQSSEGTAPVSST